MSSNKNIYDFTRTGGKPCKHCSINVVKSSQKLKSAVVRWKSTNKGGVIRINVIGNTENKDTNIKIGNLDLIMIDQTRLYFYKAIDAVIDSKTPSCMAVIKFQTKDRNISLKCYIPFITGEKITPGTNLLHKIFEEIIQYQPNENDEPSEIKDVNVLNLFPEGGTYYLGQKSYSNRKHEVNIVFNTFQAILSKDMESLGTLFGVPEDEVRSVSRLPGRKINISDYYIASKPIIESFTSMGSKSTGNNEIYIDCHPVGVDDEDEQVTVKYDEGNASRRQTQLLFILLMLLFVIFVMVILYGTNYVIQKYMT